MSSDRAGSRSDFLSLYESELLRWNSGMNLLSRRDPGKICAGLLEQCNEAAELLWAWMGARGLAEPDAPLIYADLGSGSGFPGVVWNQYLSVRAGSLQTLLVEPREKRSWFLRRVSGLEGAAPFRVARGRWGGGRVGFDDPLTGSSMVISLKALRLNDFQVLSGIPEGPGNGSNLAAGLCCVVIARFYPPGQKWDPELEDTLIGNEDLPPAGLGGSSMALCERDILGPTKGLLPASLVVTRYGLCPR